MDSNFSGHRIDLEERTHSCTISWHNIQVFSLKQRKFYDCRGSTVTEKEIIKRVSGEVKPGELLAIMGASGAGKTTLLNVLTARNLSEFLVKGVVKINGKVADTRTITSLSAYVQQTDLFLSILTVKEHLSFQACLKMDRKASKADRKYRIEQLLEEFSLTKCADTVIGGVSGVKGISGGESKRLSFASELLTNPSIMFCDEPTSGLDSYMAVNVVNCLKTLSTQGRTVICTIHQPSSQVFEMFKKLLLMADGRVAYMGDAYKALDFFESLQYKCPGTYNPSDYFIEKLAIEPGKEVECKKKIERICDSYLNSYEGKRMQILGDDTNSVEEKNGNLQQMAPKPKYKANCCVQMQSVLWRSFLTALREPQISKIRIIQTIVIALIMGIVYWQQELDQRGVMNINGALFLLLTNMTFQNAMAVVNTFCAELPLFLREHHNGLYRVDVYFLSKAIAEIPIFTMIPSIYVGIYYYMVGFNPSFDHFVIALFIAILVVQCSVSFGYLMSCVSSSATMALSLGPPFIVPLILFGGFFLNSESIPGFLIWIRYISWFYYGFESLVINQWSDIEHISCPVPDIPDIPEMASLATNLTFPSHCYRTGKDVIKQFDFNENNLVRDLLLLAVIGLVFKLMAFIALFWKARTR